MKNPLEDQFLESSVGQQKEVLVKYSQTTEINSLTDAQDVIIPAGKCSNQLGEFFMNFSGELDCGFGETQPTGYELIEK
jgi:hypothetical protein